MTINSYDLPHFDLLIAGFPCQTFSIVRKRKGLKDKRGQIIYGLLKIMKQKNLKTIGYQTAKRLQFKINPASLFDM